MQSYKKFGSFTMAYSVKADPNFSQFNHEKGSIAYQDAQGVRIFVGDPFCRKTDAEAVVKAFIKASHECHLPLVGLQCSLETARQFNVFGFNATHMGVETLILPGWTLKGKNVGRRIRKARKSKLSVSEARWDSEATLTEEAIAVSTKWRCTRSTQTPLNILLRDPTFRDEPNERTFFAWLDQQLVGYVTFEAMYDNHQKIGWYANINRRDDSRNVAVFDAIIDVALNCFKKEPGFQTLSLGLAPMACAHNTHGFANRIVAKITALSFAHGNEIYNCKGILQSKKNYWPKAPTQHPNQIEVRDTYCITHGRMPLNSVARAFMEVGILPDGLRRTVWFAVRITIQGTWREFWKNHPVNPLALWHDLTT
ncbi:DUF2156 domain-containing protein [Desulfoluna sp.]|uniref:DUF2156 domain-containing protein n=1 Tax=Desulfoluna sp. TaxID=2045199 RepID=UPI0026211656|nr:DUF2156 domain-containing protein [Desulfoluna sp.]